MDATVNIQASHAQITLTGDFTFEAHRAFKDASQSVLTNSSVSSVDIDFAGVPYMDSAALGMLLLLRERMGTKVIRLVNTRGTVKAVLDVANFGRLFEVS